jgi:hypothetical protein
MVGRRRARIGAALDDEVVGLAAHDVDLRNQKAVDVPCNAPADVAFFENELEKGLIEFILGLGVSICLDMVSIETLDLDISKS